MSFLIKESTFIRRAPNRIALTGTVNPASSLPIDCGKKTASAQPATVDRTQNRKRLMRMTARALRSSSFFSVASDSSARRGDRTDLATGGVSRGCDGERDIGI